MIIPVIKQFMDESQLNDIADYVVNVLPSRKVVTIPCDNKECAMKMAQVFNYHPKKERILEIQMYSYKIDVFYSEPMRLPFDTTMVYVHSEYAETFGW